MHRTLVLFAALAGVAALGACVDIVAEVQSNTSWSGAFGNRTVDGQGSTTVDLPDDPPQCVVVQKSTSQGSLEVRVVMRGRFLTGPSGSDWISTTAAFGVVKRV